MQKMSRKDRQEQTRERLLATAAERIARHGLAGASVRDIAEAAGYTLGAFYSNFRNKEAMLHELLERHMRDEIGQLHAIVADVRNDSSERLLGAIHDWLHQVQAGNRQVALGVAFQLHANENAQFKDRHDAVKLKRISELSDCLSEMFARLRRKPRLAPFQIAVGFTALWMGFGLLGSMDTASPVEDVVEVFLRALLDDAAPADDPQAPAEQ